MTPGIIRPGRRPIVGVMGSHDAAHAERARRVGEWVARQGYHLLTGAGGGVMAAVTEAFVAVPHRAGLALGVVPSVPGRPGAPLPGYPNPWVEIAIRAHLDSGGPAGDESSSRNHVNILTSTVVILLPGATGTASEARLAVRYGRPCVAHLRSAGEIPGLPGGIPVEADFARVADYVTRHAGPAPAATPRAAGGRRPA